MRKFLLFISLIISHLCAAQTTQRYAVEIALPKSQMTAICLMRTDSTERRGSVVNEFGIHAFDFTQNLRNQRVRLKNVLPAMNKWYLRRVLRRELRKALCGQPSRITLKPLENDETTPPTL